MNTRLPTAADAHMAETRGGADDGGYVLVAGVFVMTVLLIAAAFSVDIGFMYNTGSRAQRASDAASLAAVDELTRIELETGNRAAAEAAAQALAEDLVAQNGFDPSDPDINVQVVFSSSPGGGDRVQVIITEDNLEMFFAGIVLNDADVSRSAIAAMNDCGAVCETKHLIPPGITGLVDAGTGGDGWRPTLADTKVFNLYHHKTGDVLMCVDMFTDGPCEVGGSPSFYPLEPYPGMETNYTPKLVGVGTRVYFVVQTGNTVGLGCWDGATHARCAGFASPKQLAPYDTNGGDRGNTRVDGPELIGSRLFMYGDDNRMHCYNTATAGWCAGYPKATAIAGVHDMVLQNPAAGFAGGVVTDKIQFDMEPAPGGRIYLSLDEAPTETWIHCWDTNTNSACAGFSPASTIANRPYLFLTFDTLGNPNGVCAYAGNGGGSASGHTCFSSTGAPRGALMPWNFEVGGIDKTGQQPAWGVTSWGATRTFIPYRNRNEARCWDWTTSTSCAIPSSNWPTTQDYAYVSDGDRCIYGLGHEGFLWSFSIDDGQYPCPPGGNISTTISPCTCADGSTPVWTAIVLTADTDLSHFDTFTVEVTFPDGSPFYAGELVGAPSTIVDLHALNSLSPVPGHMNLMISAVVTEGHESFVFTVDSEIGVSLLPGILPVLVE